MTIADDITWLNSEAQWLLAIDGIANPPSGTAITAVINNLAAATPAMAQAWVTANPGSSSVNTASEAADAAISALTVFNTAVYGLSTSPNRLQSDATSFQAIASRLSTTGHAYAYDIVWLNAEVVYFGLIVPSAAAITAAATLFSAYYNTLTTSAPSAVLYANAMLNDLNLIFTSRGVGTGFQNDLLAMQITIIPDLTATVLSPYRPLSDL